MQINISMRHGHLSDASQEKIRNKASKLSRFFDRLTSIEVTVDLKDESSPSVDLRVAAEHKHDFVASEKSSSLMGAIDGSLHKMEQQLRKYKQKIQTRSRKPGEVSEADDTDTDSE